MKTAELGSAERSAQMDYTVARVDALVNIVKAQHEALEALRREVDALHARLKAIESSFTLPAPMDIIH